MRPTDPFLAIKIYSLSIWFRRKPKDVYTIFKRWNYNFRMTKNVLNADKALDEICKVGKL